MHTISEKKLLFLCPKDITPSPERPRRNFPEQELKSLACSVAVNGIIEPLCVRKEGKDKYILISGERRLRAAKMAGLRRVPCVVHKADDKDSALLTLVENIQREQLDFFEEADAIDRILGVYGVTETDIAARLGVPKVCITDKVRLLKINRLDRERILAAGLTRRHAQALLNLNERDISAVLDAVISGKLSAEETEELVCNIINPPDIIAPREEPVRKAAIGDVKFFSNSLSKLLLTMQNAGIEVSVSNRETEDYIEFDVRIEKNTTHQLAISGI